MPVPPGTGKKRKGRRYRKMVRYVVVWGYATKEGYKVGVERVSNVLEAERTAGRLHGVVVPAENVKELIRELERALRA